MNEAARVCDIAQHIPDAALRRRILECVEGFLAEILPGFASLRTQVVHNDLNPENVLLDTDDTSRVSGVIDFGDMTAGPLIVDVAVAASYMRDFRGNPMSRIAAFVGAYHSITALERREIDLIRDLILVRLATTVSVLHWRIAERGPDDPYLNNSVSAESTAGRFFDLLDSIPREHAREILRQACASTDVAMQRENWPAHKPAAGKGQPLS
jgi:Ser/Thr protein kinase RdoA (MazF antagonist)